jgi:hypothetical protein
MLVRNGCPFEDIGYTSSRELKKMNRKPIKRRAKKKEICTPQSVYREVCERSGGEWINGK